MHSQILLLELWERRLCGVDSMYSFIILPWKKQVVVICFGIGECRFWILTWLRTNIYSIVDAHRHISLDISCRKSVAVPWTAPTIHHSFIYICNQRRIIADSKVTGSEEDQTTAWDSNVSLYAICSSFTNSHSVCFALIKNSNRITYLIVIIIHCGPRQQGFVCYVRMRCIQLMTLFYGVEQLIPFTSSSQAGTAGLSQFTYFVLDASAKILRDTFCIRCR